MPQITFDNLSVSFSDKPILNAVSGSIYKGEKIALIGRNGEGKSTLMKVIAGLIEPNDGEIKIKNNTNISYLEQSVPTDSEKTVFEIVALGFNTYDSDDGDIIAGYQSAINTGNLENSAKFQEQIEKRGIWDKLNEVAIILERFGLQASEIMQNLSGGWRRRVMLAKAIVGSPDVLMLDEPTNHMDIDAILSLEKMLTTMHTTLLLISHDRSFVAGIVTKVFDLDRGKLRIFDCGYRDYIKRKDEVLNAEALEQARFDKKLSEEEAWIRQGIKARRTRNEGRVRALVAMRNEFKERRATKGSVKIHTLDEEKRVSKLVFEVKNISYHIAEKKLVTDFSTLVMKGDKIGIIGGNGVGKSTLIKLLLGELEPQQGNIRRSKTLKLAYFDQMGEALNPHMLAKDFVGDGSERIEISGKSRHVIGYLRNFLFTGKQALAPIRMLSGGEKNRLMLAKILAKPANLLVLDEPTNDLDVETLELLEEMLREYQGTLIVISHDREFLNNVVGSTIVMDGKDIVRYAGGYDDYLAAIQSAPQQTNHTQKTKKSPQTTSATTVQKLSFNQQQELKKLPKTIEKTEQTIEKLQRITMEEGFYQRDDFEKVVKELKVLEQTLEELYNRWEELDAIK
jgi:ATP-binding cassette subfamily F protein uup